MARYIKEKISQEAIDTSDQTVRATVEGILEDIRARGDKAVRELSLKFDDWNPRNFRLSDTKREEILASLPE